MQLLQHSPQSFNLNLLSLIQQLKLSSSLSALNSLFLCLLLQFSGVCKLVANVQKVIDSQCFVFTTVFSLFSVSVVQTFVMTGDNF
jgi:hypothetical protein